TEGKPKLVSIEVLAGFTEIQVMEFASALERGSEHPLAAAILQGSKDRGIVKLPEVQNFEAVTGQGVTAQIKNDKAALGNLKLMKGQGVDVSQLEARAEVHLADGQTVVFL